MADSGIYLEKLAMFGRLLQQEGMAVSPQETADACRMLTELGMEDRETVRAALRTVYAKSRVEQERFDRVFRSFFRSEEAVLASAERMAKEQEEKERARAEAGSALQPESDYLFYSEAQKEAFAELPEAEKERLRRLKETYLGEDSRNQALYSGLIHSIFTRSILEQQMRMEDAAEGAAPIDPELGLLFRDISEFQDQDIPKAVSCIADIARQMNGELTRKRRHSGRNDRPDFRRTIRKGLSTGGALTRLVYRKKRIRKRKLIILCDVSGSMLQFSEFVLRFILSLNETADSSQVFLFSESLVEADAFHLQDMDRFRDYVRDSGVFGRGTALGAALRNLNDRLPPVLTPGSLLLILSDAKTVDLPLALRELSEASRKAGRIAWLNPIAERKWKYHSATRAFSELCTMLPCNTLNELRAAAKRLMIT